jgi:EAL domain-containing protein (putative c-di-GMP-specific phosphodiesterase class I)
VGVEALIRWQHPDRGLMLPETFIGLGEETGLIVPIGQWVLQTACRQVQAWFDAGVAPIMLAVNISARQLAGDKALIDEVANVLAETGFPPAFLQLEITETAIMRNAEEASDVIRRLKSLGVSIAIDDFGTGYSSMMYLKRFAVDKLKTDQSFVRDLAYDANDQAITEAIIGLGHSLHAKVVAEGVESAEQRLFLHAHGCDEMQGFLFSPPLPEPECLRLLKKLH